MESKRNYFVDSGVLIAGQCPKANSSNATFEIRRALSNRRLISPERINHRLGDKATLRDECDGLVGPDPQIWIKNDHPLANEGHSQSEPRITKPEGPRSEG
ncbi:hypothetical protein RS9916_29254 [Synechococcus sp. RS9916]|nr:hypothetical protein RS9916_29254 [Synechococcus sp. RS9916]